MVATQKQTVIEVAGDLLLEKREQIASGVAELRGRPTGATAMTKPEQREAFWKRFVSPEQEAAMLAAGQSRMAVSAVVYQRRWELWNDEGTSLTDKLKWAREMVKLGPPGEDGERSARNDVPASRDAEVSDASELS